jgi:hypothetical protein
MKISRNEALGLTAIGTIAYLAYNLLKSKQELKDKEKQYTEDLQEAVEEVEAEVMCHIHDELINKAVEKAVDKRVNDILSKGTDKAIESAKNRINSEISATIQSYWKSKKDSVSDDILVKVGKLDVDEIREEAVNKARDKAMTSIDSKIDDVISGMRENADKRIEAAITKAENRIERKSSDMLLDLKSTYNLTRQILNV